MLDQSGDGEDAPTRLPGQGEQVFVAGHQSVGAAGGCQVQEGLVVRVAAPRHDRRWFTHRHDGGEGKVVGQQLGLIFGR